MRIKSSEKVIISLQGQGKLLI